MSQSIEFLKFLNHVPYEAYKWTAIGCMGALGLTLAGVGINHHVHERAQRRQQRTPVDRPLDDVQARFRVTPVPAPKDLPPPHKSNLDVNGRWAGHKEETQQLHPEATQRIYPHPADERVPDDGESDDTRPISWPLPISPPPANYPPTMPADPTNRPLPLIGED